VQALAVVTYPDPRLKTPAAPVEAFDAGLEQNVAALLRGLREIPARGLAGPHLGIMWRIVAIDLVADGRAQPQVFVNPVVLTATDATAEHEEGSVSLPGVHETVRRPAGVTVGWQTPAGEVRQEVFDGFMAACLQHEIDQCDGVFWLERLSRLKRERVLARFDKINRQAEKERRAGAR
jgi:peptide deformylase